MRTEMTNVVGKDMAEPRCHKRLLLVTAVRLRLTKGRLQLDDQTCAGLGRWAENFEFVTFAGILTPPGMEDETSVTWQDVDDLPCRSELSFIQMPYAYKFKTFFAAFDKTRRVLSRAIGQSDTLCFTLGALAGDWGAVASLEAIRLKRPFAVWFDRVEHDVIRSTLATYSFKRQLKERLTLPVMERYHYYLIGKSSLGLFQGRDTFDAYAPYARQAEMMFDVHTQTEDFASDDVIERKLARIEANEPLKICYVGRATAMKGPEDWILVLAALANRGVKFHATWTGDGPDLPRMQSMVQERSLQSMVDFRAYERDRHALLEEIKSSHVFLFCHKTAESPRCLIEALVCATPLVGYTSAYAEGLLHPQVNGSLSLTHDIEGLADIVAALDRDRPRLARLVRIASDIGKGYDEASLYRQRAVALQTYT